MEKHQIYMSRWVVGVSTLYCWLQRAALVLDALWCRKVSGAGKIVLWWTSFPPGESLYALEALVESASVESSLKRQQCSQEVETAADDIIFLAVLLFQKTKTTDMKLWVIKAGRSSNRWDSIENRWYKKTVSRKQGSETVCLLVLRISHLKNNHLSGRLVILFFWFKNKN